MLKNVAVILLREDWPPSNFILKSKLRTPQIHTHQENMKSFYLTIKMLAEDSNSGFKLIKKKNGFRDLGKKTLEFYLDKAWLAWWRFSNVLWPQLLGWPFRQKEIASNYFTVELPLLNMGQKWEGNGEGFMLLLVKHQNWS